MKWSRKPAVWSAWTVWALLLLSVVLVCGCTLAQPEIDTSGDGQTSTEEAVDDAQGLETREPREEIAEDAGATTAASDEGVEEVRTPTAETSPYQDAWAPREGYTLKQVVAVSRHNLRSTLDRDQDVLNSATTHEWYEYDAPGGDLTNKGGVAETIMGQFFRQWQEEEGLQPTDWMPLGGEVRFYSNAFQRTIATAQYFSSGMLPVANVDIEWHGEYGVRDGVYKARNDIDTDRYKADAIAELTSGYGDAGMAGFDAELQDSYDLIMDVCDYRNSEGYRAGDLKDLVVGDSDFVIERDAEPKPVGSITTAAKLSDGLVLQYLATEDDTSASFGRKLTEDEWKTIAAAKVVYYDRIYNADLLSVDCAYTILNEVDRELSQPGRLFSFLGCHDRNMSALLHALGVTDYALFDTLETRIPIGSKILFERWEADDGGQFMNIRIVYATTEQLRHLVRLTLDNPPASHDLEFASIERNADGLFALKDVADLFEEKLDYHDEILNTYEGEAELDNAA